MQLSSALTLAPRATYSPLANSTFLLLPKLPEGEMSPCRLYPQLYLCPILLTLGPLDTFLRNLEVKLRMIIEPFQLGKNLISEMEPSSMSASPSSSSTLTTLTTLTTLSAFQFNLSLELRFFCRISSFSRFREKFSR